jgi:8-oxo-dGTP diphosphatase
VRGTSLCVLLWERARDPFSGAWALPGGTLVSGESLEASIQRHLATKVDVRDVSHLEQLGTWSHPARHPDRWELATAYLGLVPLGVDPRVPADTTWHSVAALPDTAFDHGAIVLAGRDRLRAKLSYSNIGFALAPDTFTLAELRDIYEAALDYEVSATNLKRVLVRRGAIETVGRRRAHGPAGGRPAELYRFSTRRLEVTDQFAVLRPPL